MQRSENLSLIGMPAAGKSTIGIILAKTLGMPFIDTDILIQTRAGLLLQQIIAQKGIEAFLRQEEETICSLQLQGHIIATGGSAVYGSAAMTHLKNSGRIIYLRISYPEMARRLGNIATRGVIIRPGQDLQGLYNMRSPLYASYADLNLDANGCNPENVVEEIIKLLEQGGGL